MDYLLRVNTWIGKNLCVNTLIRGRLGGAPNRVVLGNVGRRMIADTYLNFQ